MFRIGEFSKLAKTTVKTLLYYDKVGLLKPAFVDSDTSYRYYSEAQLEIMRGILAYKAVGIQNSDISDILKNGNADAILSAKREQLEALMKSISGQLNEIDRMLCQASKQKYSAEIKNIPAFTVYCCRGYIQSLSDIRSFIDACNKELHLTNPNVKFSVPDYCCVIYPGEGYRENNIFIEYVQSTDRIGIDAGAIKFKTLDSITAISVTHRGGYENLRDAYLFAVKWAADNGFELCGEARERYINGAWNMERESDWLTEVQLPIKSKNK